MNSDGKNDNSIHLDWEFQKMQNKNSNTGIYYSITNIFVV